MAPKKAASKSKAEATSDAAAEVDVAEPADAGTGPKKAAPRKRKRQEKPNGATAEEGGEATESPAKRAAPKQKAVPKEEEEGEDQQEEEAVVPSKAKKPRQSGVKKAAPKKAIDEEEGEEEPEGDEEEGPPKKKAAKPKKSKAPPWPVYNESMRKPPPSEPHIKILSWNVAGLRAVLKKDPESIKKLLSRESPDVVCLQELKISDKHVEDLLPQLGIPEDWHASWLCSAEKAGYSGVATLSKVPPRSVQKGVGEEAHDGEGRLLITEFKDFYLINVYVPNSGEGLKRLDYRVKPGGWDDTLATTIKKLQKTKPVLVTGDLNCAHEEIDIYYPKTNMKSAGFTPEERESFGTRYLSPPESGGCGLVDAYRKQFPETVAYTYYSYRFNCRAKGIGWRLDYFLASQGVESKVYDSWVLADVTGSDHVPLGVTLVNTSL